MIMKVRSLYTPWIRLAIFALLFLFFLFGFDHFAAWTGMFGLVLSILMGGLTVFVVLVAAWCVKNLRKHWEVDGKWLRYTYWKLGKMVDSYDLSTLKSTCRLPQSEIRLDFEDGRSIQVPDMQKRDGFIVRMSETLQTLVPNCPVLEPPPSAKNWFVRLLVILETIILIYVLFSIYFYVQRNNVFESALSFFTPVPEGSFVSGNGDFWYMMEPIGSSSMYIFRKNENGTQRWKAPSFAKIDEFFPAELDEFIRRVPVQAIETDHQGNPILMTRQYLYYWEDETWRAQKLQNFFYADRFFYTAPEDIWIVANALIQINLPTGQETRYELPEEQKSAGGRLSDCVLRNEQISCLAVYQEKGFLRVFSFDAGNWQEQFELPIKEPFIDQMFAVDADNAVWVTPRGEVAGLYKWSPQTKQGEWMRLDVPINVAETLYVDERGRIWLGDYYELTVVAKGDNLYRAVRYYDQTNSNYPGAGAWKKKPYVSADGKMWFLNDRGYHYIDTQAEDLPIVPPVLYPLLEWIFPVRARLILITLAGCILTVFEMILNVRIVWTE